MPLLRGWRPPIAAVLVFGFGGLIAGAVGTVLLVALDIAERNTNDLLRQTAELSIDRLIGNLAHHLQPPRSQVEFLARRLSGGAIPLDDDGRLQDLLLGSLAAAPQIAGVAFVRDDLHAVRAGREAGRTEAESGNWLDRPEVRLALREGPSLPGFAWGDVLYLDSRRSSFISSRMPVRQGDRFRGLLIAVVSIGELSNYLASMTQPLAGRTFVLRGRDEVIAHPLLVGGPRNSSPAHPLPKLDELGDSVLAALWSAPFEEADDVLADSNVTGRIVFVNGRANDYENAYLFLYREIAGYGSTPWLVGLYIRLQDASEPLRRLVLVAATGGGVLIVAVVLALLLGRSLGVPIRRLAAAADAIRDLRLEAAAPLKGSLYRELHVAGRAFEAMLAGLRWFETYVPRSLVARLIRQGQHVDLPSEERDVTVMFTDIVGFTAIGGRLPAPRLAAFLNRHFGLLATCIEVEAGTVDKYIGDSVMAFWGAPMVQPDHAQRACRAAQGIAAAIAADNRRRVRKGLRPVRVRVGIHTGPALVGNVGAPGRVNYTLIGDTVNTADRVQELGKTFDRGDADVTILVSETTAAAVSSRFELEPLGPHHLRGRTEPLAVYRLK